MDKKDSKNSQLAGECLRLRPDLRLCSQYAPGCLTRLSTAIDRDRTDFKVMDDFVEEHIM